MLIEVFAPSGYVLYAILRNFLGSAWNNVAKQWETFDPAKWVQYCIPLLEESTCGYYKGAVPPEIPAGRITTLIYQQLGGGPDMGDERFGNSSAVWDGTYWEAGWSTTTAMKNVNLVYGLVDANVMRINANVEAARKLAISADSMVTGKAVAGTLTVTQMTTDLTNTLAKAYAGRVVYFTSGGLAGRVAAISDYAVLNGKLSFASPLPIAPVADDEFIIV